MFARFNKREVGERIREIRTNLGYSMSEFGYLIGSYPRSSVNNWEKGICLPKRYKLEKIALLGNVSVDFILFGNIEEFVRDLIGKNLKIVGSKKEKEDFLKRILLEVPEKERKYDSMMWLSVINEFIFNANHSV